MLKLIKASLFEYDTLEIISEDIYMEMKQHAIVALPAPILSSMIMSVELRKKWRNSILQIVSYNAQYRYIQLRLPITVPYVILKGSAAAMYYPYPEYRTMGDIDVITRREEFQIACDDLRRNGYNEKKDSHESNSFRHRCFTKNGFCIEVHSYFAIFTDIKRSEYLDSLILDNINSTHYLPDNINGLVLLAHIDQHLEQGIGLRQIIDWMMFVDKCMPDDKWPDFSYLAEKIGLKKLAIVVTRMCELFLGLPERKWCAEADQKLCKQLMNYILSCGNFGNKKSIDNVNGQNVFSFFRSPILFLKLLQKRGIINWKLVQKYPILTPLAWAYQMGRYLFKGFGRNEASKLLLSEFTASRERKKLCDSLGATQASKGIVVYKNGKYVKE